MYETYTEKYLMPYVMENLNLVQTTEILIHLSEYFIKPNYILEDHLNVRVRYLNVHCTRICEILINITG